MWYKTGSISVTNGSATVTGSGTSWIANAEVGEALYAPDGRLYEITNIASNTSMTITPAYLGSGQTGQAYTIVPSQSYIRDLAAQAADLVNNYSTIANTIGQGKFPDGTLANPAFKFADDLDTGFYRSAANEVTFVANGVAQFRYNASGISLITGGNLVGTTATQTLTNKTINLTSNTLVATSAQLRTAVTDETGTGVLVFNSSPTLTTPTITGGTVNPTTLQEGSSPAVIQTDIGTAPNEIPLNQYLGNLAYQDAENIAGDVGIENLTADVATVGVLEVLNPTGDAELAVRSTHTAGTDSDATLVLDASTGGESVVEFKNGDVLKAELEWRNSTDILRMNSIGDVEIYTGAAPQLGLYSDGKTELYIPSDAPTISEDSTMSFQLVSNTTLRILVRGDDGTTRSVDLTLA